LHQETNNGVGDNQLKQFSIMVKNDFSKACLFFNIKECQKAYKLGGNDTTLANFTIDGMLDEDAYHAVFETWWKKLPLEEQKRLNYEVRCKNKKIHLQWHTFNSFNPETDNLPPTEIEYPNMVFPTKVFRNLAQYVYWVASGYESDKVILDAWGVNKIDRFLSTSAKKNT
jgi:hypothetical protein